MKKFLPVMCMVSASVMLVACGNSASSSSQSLSGGGNSEETSVVISSESSVSSVSSALEEDSDYLSTGPFYTGYYSDEIKELTVGDTYKGVKLTKLQYRPEGKTVEGNADGTTIFYPPDESATMEGEITLRGKLSILDEGADVPGFVWIDLDEESANKIPYPKLSRDAYKESESLFPATLYLVREGGEENAPENALNKIKADILADITNLKQADEVPCEITISKIYFTYIWDIRAYEAAVLKDFKLL